jgi:hypothetical protein
VRAIGYLNGKTVMTINYSLTRFEIVRTFVAVLPQSPRIFTIVFISSAWPGFVMLLSKHEFSNGLTVWDFLGALIFGSVAFLLLLTWVFLRAKTRERTLTISEHGVHTEIGRIKADYPWSKVKQIKDVGQYLLVVNRTGNAFFIPDRAFPSAKARTEFLELANEWRRAC